MRRRMLECASCHRRFKIPQALFGHLRHCRWHRLKRQAKAKAGNQPPGQRQSQQNMPKPPAGDTEAVSVSQRRGRDSQENLLLLLDGSEMFPRMKRKCIDYTAIARMLANVRPGITTTEKWVALYWTLDECERDYEQMVMRLRLDRTILFRTYQQMLVVKRSWLNYLWNDFAQTDETVSDEVNTTQSSAWDEEEQLWDTLMTNIKKMLVSSH